MVAGHAECGGERLHHRDDLRSRRIFREHLQILQRRRWRTAALSLWGLSRGRRQRAGQDEHTKHDRSSR